jgi:hypothetical protein
MRKHELTQLLGCTRCAAPLQMPQRHMSRANSNSSNGLLSHAMRAGGGGGGSNEGNGGGGNGRELSAVANGNGYSSRHSSEYSNDDEWDGVVAQQREQREHLPHPHREARPGSTAASSKVCGGSLTGTGSDVSCPAGGTSAAWTARMCMQGQVDILCCMLEPM